MPTVYQNQFTSDALELNDSRIQGGVKLTQSVNSGDQLVLGSCCAASVEFSVLDLENEIPNPQGIEFLYLKSGTQIGYFTAEAERQKAGWKITAYDRMMRFEQIVDQFISGLPDKFTLRELLEGLCREVDVPLSSTPFTNDSLHFYKNFEGSDIKGRDVLYWIAEAAGCFAVFNAEGTLELKFYDTEEPDTEHTITNADYTDFSLSEFQTPAINKLQIRSTEDDVGYIVYDESKSEEEGDVTNAYIIEGNPLFYVRSTNSEDEEGMETVDASDENSNEATIRAAAEAIFSKLNGFCYQPFSCDLYENGHIPAPGTSILIKPHGGKEVKSYVMEQVCSGMKYTVSASGSNQANELKSVNISLTQRNNKLNELKRTLDATVSTVSELNQGAASLQTKIEQALDSVNITITSERDARADDLNNFRKELEDKTNTLVEGVSHLKSTSVVIDDVGITVGGTTFQTKTEMTPEAFKVLGKNGEERINVTSEGTLLQRTIIQDDLTIGIVKIIKLDNGVDFVVLGDEL